MRLVPSLLILVAVSAPGVHAQAPSAETPGADLTIYLVTIGPGTAAWERFGHNAIGVRDERRGTDRIYNYGLFSFAQEGFLVRFLRGRMEYWMAGFDAAPHLRSYMAAGRSLAIQVLDLAPQQRRELADFLEWNERPENRFYRYHYYWDNCSTRVRDALDRALGGALRDVTTSVNEGSTFRYHTRRALAVDPLLYAGIMLGLGSPTDRSLSQWEEMFLPEKVQEYIREVTVTSPDGAARPLVISEQTVFEGSAEPIPDAAPRRLHIHFAIGLLIAAVILVLAWRSAQSTWARRAFLGLGVTWTLLVGALGAAIAGLWALTDHDTSYWNENLFVVNPLWLVAAVALVVLWWRGGQAHQTAHRLVTALAALGTAGFFLQILPGLDQVNGDVYALCLPAALALSAGLWISSAPARSKVASA